MFGRHSPPSFASLLDRPAQGTRVHVNHPKRPEQINPSRCYCIAEATHTHSAGITHCYTLLYGDSLHSYIVGGSQSSSPPPTSSRTQGPSCKHDLKSQNENHEGDPTLAVRHSQSLSAAPSFPASSRPSLAAAGRGATTELVSCPAVPGQPATRSLHERTPEGLAAADQGCLALAPAAPRPNVLEGLRRRGAIHLAVTVNPYEP